MHAFSKLKLEKHAVSLFLCKEDITIIIVRNTNPLDIQLFISLRIFRIFLIRLIGTVYRKVLSHFIYKNRK